MITDCHVHLFDPARFPYRPDTVYTPSTDETAPLEALEAVLLKHGVTRAVLVGPVAGYNTDNRCLLSALRLNRDRFRGIAIVDPSVSDQTLDEMEATGVVGARFDLISLGTDYLRTTGYNLLKRLIDRDWIIDIQCEKQQLARQAGLLERGGRIVVDHIGRPDPQKGLDQPGFRALLDLAGSDRVWVKLSGPFRASAQRYPYADMDKFFEAILTIFPPQRMLWGSDWPFVRLDEKPDYSATLMAFQLRVRDETVLDSILSDAPSKLFGWPVHV